MLLLANSVKINIPWRNQKVLKLESCRCVFLSGFVESKGVNSTRLVACITTLYLFSKIRAQLMVKHAMTMQPYLTTKCNVSCVCDNI